MKVDRQYGGESVVNRRLRKQSAMTRLYNCNESRTLQCGYFDGQTKLMVILKKTYTILNNNR